MGVAVRIGWNPLDLLCVRDVPRENPKSEVRASLRGTLTTARALMTTFWLVHDKGMFREEKRGSSPASQSLAQGGQD